MLLTKPVTLKPNSRKWHLLTSWQGLSKLTNGKAHMNAASVATQFQNCAAKRCQVVSIAHHAKPQGSE
ncbi:hypothetical protein BCT54_05565 [Vibrio splendidus]|uniref:Uncharacterized protein n=1 Tax=Vibrio splendidus TaxID=29497 RepID=A0A2N7JNR9_VIBSP|nr:hypothetical protein BCT54_05565 [Vibrio splendidus]